MFIPDTGLLLLLLVGRCERRLGGGIGVVMITSSISPLIFIIFSADRFAIGFIRDDGEPDVGRIGVFGRPASSNSGYRSAFAEFSRIDGKYFSVEFSSNA